MMNLNETTIKNNHKPFHALLIEDFTYKMSYKVPFGELWQLK